MPRHAGLMAAVVVLSCSVAFAQEEEVEVGPVLDLTRLSSQHHVYPVDLRLPERFVLGVPESFPAHAGEFGISETATIDMLPWWLVEGGTMPRPVVQGANWVDLRVATELQMGGKDMTIHGPERTRVENRVDGVAAYTTVPDPDDTGLAVFVDPQAWNMRIGSLLRAAAAEEQRRIIGSRRKPPES